MKMVIIASFVLAVALAQTSHAEMVCSETEYSYSYKRNLPILDDDEEIIQINKPLFQGGKITCEVGFSLKTLENNTRIRIETGTLEGVKYRIRFSDGIGTVQGLSTNTLDKDKYGTNWSTRCRLDEMDDRHWCFLDRGDLTIWLTKDGTPYVLVGYDHYPGSKIAVRVDKNKPITASAKIGFAKAQSLEIIEQLKNGQSALTRYEEWPYQIYRDSSVELFGFPQAWEILQKLHESAGIQQ